MIQERVQPTMCHVTDPHTDHTQPSFFFFNIKNILETPLNILNWGSLGNLPLLRGRLAEWLNRFWSQMPWI